MIYKKINFWEEYTPLVGSLGLSDNFETILTERISALWVEIFHFSHPNFWQKFLNYAFLNNCTFTRLHLQQITIEHCSIQTIKRNQLRTVNFYLPGDCQEGWYDSSSVGLGCILPDLTDHDIDEVASVIDYNIVVIKMKTKSSQPSSETVCSQFGEGGRLVEVFVTPPLISSLSSNSAPP